LISGNDPKNLDIELLREDFEVPNINIDLLNLGIDPQSLGIELLKEDFEVPSLDIKALR